MDGKASKLTVETSDGRTAEYKVYKDLMFPKEFEDSLKMEFGDHVNKVINLPVDKSDVLLATYPKAGTHWAWEIISMLREGTSDYMKKDKETMFLDMVKPEKIAAVPSPRVLNSHFTPRCIPRDVLQNGVKVVHVQRNVKDVLVSFYHHMKQDAIVLSESFDAFFELFIGTYGVMVYCTWIHYVKEWEAFSKRHPQQILNIYYEDMKEDAVREVRKINGFLECGRSDELIQEIVEACSFHKLKVAETKKEREFDDTLDIYRKGEVGDWKNWLTVAQNERMDQWLAETFTNTELQFRYTL